MPARNEAFVLINAIETAGTGAEPVIVGYQYVVLAPDNTVLTAVTTGSVNPGISYGDSVRDIQNTVAASVRAATSDSDLNVTFVV